MLRRQRLVFLPMAKLILTILRESCIYITEQDGTMCKGLQPVQVLQLVPQRVLRQVVQVRVQPVPVRVQPVPVVAVQVPVQPYENS